jgi:hypothetical protein
LKHLVSPKFWRLYQSLPKTIRDLADKNFKLLKADPTHPSLAFKRVGKYRSVRIGLTYRALAYEVPDGLVWFWIGNHSNYDKIVG